MAVAYTNSKGVTYYLCRGKTKAGKPRYYFAKQQKEEPVDSLPKGYEITESPNGIVSLARIRPKKILEEEVAAVENAIAKHPESRRYKVHVKHDRIEIYERTGGVAPSDLLKEMFGKMLSSNPLPAETTAQLDAHGQFSAVLRFVLIDEKSREFAVQRWCYRGSIDDWIFAGVMGQIDRITEDVIRTLGTDAFFEMY